MGYTKSRWLIVELNDLIDKIDYKEIESAIHNTFGDKVEYFIPIHHETVGTYTSTSTLMEGYIFLKDSPVARENSYNIKENGVFSKILVEKNGKFQTISSTEIRSLRLKLKKTLSKKFVEGSKVRILDGIFKNLIGEVIGVEDGGKKVIVRIKRISREMIAPIPSTLLERVV